MKSTPADAIFGCVIFVILIIAIVMVRRELGLTKRDITDEIVTGSLIVTNNDDFASLSYTNMSIFEVSSGIITNGYLRDDDCFTRNQVQPLINALVALYEANAGVPSESCSIARDALDYAGSIGF